MTKRAKVTKSDIALAINSIVDVVNSGYTNYNSKLAALNVDENVLSVILKDGMLFSDAIPNNWYRDRVINALLSKNPILGSEILSDRVEAAKNPEEGVKSSYCEADYNIITMILRSGYYSDISVLDDAALYLEGDPQRFAVEFCSVSALRKLTTVKDSKVRRIVYQRLGPVECLDEMITDKIKDIRYDGVSRAPLGYPKLDSMIKEIARDVFNVLVHKIDIGTLPMLLANRNIKNNWIASRVESRLNSGK